MLEVLIAVLILSIGLLGLAGLQATSLRNNHGSYLRTQANLMAYEMADRIRSNPQGVTAGAYDSITTTIPGSYTDCSTSTCTPTQLATYDAWRWNTDLASTLPSGRGSVTNNGGLFTITVMWDEERTGATGENCGADKTVDLTCFRVSFVP